MVLSATGTSVLGRQVLGTTTTNDRYFSVVWTGYNDASPITKRLGTLVLEQDVGSGDWRGVASKSIWTNGALIDLTFNQIVPMRVVAVWREAGIPWLAVTAGTPR